MNDESIDVNISFINTGYFSVSVRDGCISVIGRINKLEMEKFIKAQYFEIKEILDKIVRKVDAMKELKDLIAGDDVLVVGRSCRRIAKIDKVTKTQIVVNNARFRRDSGWQCGGDRWNVRRISVPTEKEISDIEEEDLRKALIYVISSSDFERLSTDKLKQVYNIVKGKENEKE